ncbi:SMC-Scp complex subunit ScpB [Kordiimonas sp. SCSIO 12610]|nr:SMC-Scp complex subunit ScpB [Kordiimonas sp. SCSIO 12610]
MIEPRDLEHERMIEAILFASDTPLSIAEVAERVPDGIEIDKHILALTERYKTRGFRLVKVAGKYMFRTADDLAFLLRKDVDETRKLSKAGTETLAIIAYHQPVTRTEIEEIRGVTISKGTLDVLMEVGWIKVKGRRQTPGRPVTYGTTDEFLIHFGIESTKDLPGVKELKASGLLDSVDVALDKMEMTFKSDTDENSDQIDLEEAIALSEREAIDAEKAADDFGETDTIGGQQELLLGGE